MLGFAVYRLRLQKNGLEILGPCAFHIHRHPHKETNALSRNGPSTRNKLFFATMWPASEQRSLGLET